MTTMEDAEKVLPDLVWTRVPTSPDVDATARVYRGIGDGWIFTVSTFDITNQGYPPGSRGYDAIGLRNGVIIPLTRPLSKIAVILAETKIRNLS